MTIDDEVFKEAKVRAVREGRTLGELITEALRERMARTEAIGDHRYVAVTYGEGGPLPGVDVANNAAPRDLMDDA